MYFWENNDKQITRIQNEKNTNFRVIHINDMNYINVCKICGGLLVMMSDSQVWGHRFQSPVEPYLLVI